MSETILGRSGQAGQEEREEVDLFIDGQLQERPVTKFSRRSRPAGAR